MNVLAVSEAPALELGLALRKLAHLPTGDRRREQLQTAADDAYARQCALEVQRKSVPQRAPLRDTELSRRLRYHPGTRHIPISLEPAGTERERRAFAALLALANRRRLTLPGDPSGRPLRFRIANS